MEEEEKARENRKQSRTVPTRRECAVGMRCRTLVSAAAPQTSEAITEALRRVHQIPILVPPFPHYFGILEINLPTAFSTTLSL